MQVAVRLEAAVGDACVPPIALTAGDAAAEAAERQLWRALKLVELVGAWRDQLADGALRELAAALLAQHALPYLRAQLAAAPLGLWWAVWRPPRARCPTRGERVAEGVGRRRAPRCWPLRPTSSRRRSPRPAGARPRARRSAWGGAWRRCSN